MLFIRTTLFTTLFTVIIFVCIPSDCLLWQSVKCPSRTCMSPSGTDFLYCCFTTTTMFTELCYMYMYVLKTW